MNTKQAALIKLAQVRCAINHVLRMRAMQKQAEDAYHPANELEYAGNAMIDGWPRWVYPNRLPPATPLQGRLLSRIRGGRSDYTDFSNWSDTASALKSRNPFNKWLGAANALGLGADLWKHGPSDLEWQIDQNFKDSQK